MLDRLLGLFSNDMGIDLGTANTLVYLRQKGIVLYEPSVVAVRTGTNQVLAVGNRAKMMLGRTPGQIVAMRPLKDGVIADFDVAEAMLRDFIVRAHNRKALVHPRVIVAVPSGITEVEKRAVVESGMHAGARQVYLVEEPMAAAIGSGLPVQEPGGNLIVDIGGGTTEVAVISLAGLVISETVRVGGDEMDQAIVAHMKKKHGLLIGERSAENVKITIGSAYKIADETTMDVKGRDEAKGLPRTVSITSTEVRKALLEPIRIIIQTVTQTLERTPPELAADLVETGVVLAGGGALLPGLADLIAKETGLPVRVTDDPITAVVRGTGQVLDELDALREVLVAGGREW